MSDFPPQGEGLTNIEQLRTSAPENSLFVANAQGRVVGTFSPAGAYTWAARQTIENADFQNHVRIVRGANIADFTLTGGGGLVLTAEASAAFGLASRLTWEEVSGTWTLLPGSTGSPQAADLGIAGSWRDLHLSRDAFIGGDLDVNTIAPASGNLDITPAGNEVVLGAAGSARFRFIGAATSVDADSSVGQFIYTAGGGSFPFNLAGHMVIAPRTSAARELVLMGDESAVGMRVSPSGIGFFGATPVAQQNVPATSPDLDDVITALVNLGLVEQSD